MNPDIITNIADKAKKANNSRHKYSEQTPGTNGADIEKVDKLGTINLKHRYKPDIDIANIIEKARRQQQ